MCHDCPNWNKRFKAAGGEVSSWIVLPLALFAIVLIVSVVGGAVRPEELLSTLAQAMSNRGSTP